MPPILIDGIVGARPNLMKVGPLARALEADGTFSLRLVHTGQHYDERLSTFFFEELDLRAPAFNLEVGSGPHGQQTGRILERYEQVLLRDERPRGVIVVGDVNSTLACALAAAKLQIPVAHVEAGLRSWDRTMPEEINRVLTDALSEVLLVSDPDGLANLAREGHPRERIRLVGNIMIDTLYRQLPQAEACSVLDELGLRAGQYVYVTLHRPANVDEPAVLERLVGVLEELAREVDVVFSAHPRTRAGLDRGGICANGRGRLRIIGPLPYTPNLRMMRDARAVLTDSGGIQEETSVLGVPCLTLRNNTERPVTVDLGTSVLVGNDPERIRAAWCRLRRGEWKTGNDIPLWDGRTAQRIVAHLREVWA